MFQELPAINMAMGPEQSFGVFSEVTISVFRDYRQKTDLAQVST